jgi:hypothetical protein
MEIGIGRESNRTRITSSVIDPEFFTPQFLSGDCLGGKHAGLGKSVCRLRGV